MLFPSSGLKTLSFKKLFFLSESHLRNTNDDSFEEKPNKIIRKKNVRYKRRRKYISHKKKRRPLLKMDERKSKIASQLIMIKLLRN